MTIPSILLDIRDEKILEVNALYKSGKAKEYEEKASNQDPTINFAASISRPGYPHLIAEFKRASPSEGPIRPGANPEEIAELYERCGASAISVLTHRRFDAEIDHLMRVRSVVSIPVLRKGFIIDKAQIYESRVFGADAILLIAALLETSQIRDFIGIANSLSLDCLVEVHNEGEIEKVVKTDTKIPYIFGINNRNLHTFETDINTTLRLLEQGYIPEGYPLVTESGIHTYDDVKKLSHPRINAMLVGTTLMRAKDIEKKIDELLGKLS